MSIVNVKFDGTTKVYTYNTKLNLMPGGRYQIIADERTSYDNAVEVIHIQPGTLKGYRTITEAKLLCAPPKPEKLYKNIYVDYEKEAVCVVWTDGSKTIMKPQPEDFFDVEKGIALAFMKKCCGNRGCFNDIFRDITIIR